MAIFLLFYKLLLEKESMHVFKRFYLMLALIAALIIPELVFIEYVEPVSTTYTNSNSFIETSTSALIGSPASDIDVINWPLLAWTIYGIGTLIFGVRFLRNLFQIFNRVRRNTKVKQGFGIKVLLLAQLPPHTFFKYIFLNKEKFETNTIPKEVLLHEEIHAKQRHSIDVVFVELLQVILWFNPLLYFFKKSIKLNHEFLADSAVIAKNISTSNYQNTLLSYLSQDSANKYQSVNMANAINYSSIKKRFKVMKTQTSKKAILLRSLLLLPLLALMLYGFSETKTIERTNPDVEKNIKEELEHVNQLQINYPDGATKQMMLEYEQFIFEYGKTNSIDYGSYQRAIAIYDLMTEDQKKTVKKYPDFPILNDMNITEVRALSSSKFGAYKNKETYAIWIDGNVVDNKQLNEFQASDFVHFIESFVYKNARSDKFPQEYQVQLYTEKGFQEAFNKDEASSKELAKFNILAEKYNAVSIENRVIPLEDLKVLEAIYRKMSSEQKEKAQPFPECLPKNIQKGASREQMAKYNSLAKKYNEMDSDNMRILMKDVEQLKYIYSIMSDKQKADVEPFPDFPEPPPAPKAINNSKTPLPPPPPMDTIFTYNRLSKRIQTVTRNREANIVYLKELYSKMNASQKRKVISPIKIIKAKTPKSPEVPIYTSSKNTIIQVEGPDSPEKMVPTPPLPPKPLKPLDHIIAMAKKGATFYYEGKEISSDKAIELIKKNKSLNISTTKSNSKNPQVRISKKPIKLGYAKEPQDSIKSSIINGVLTNQNAYTNFDNPLVRNTFIKNSSNSHYISTKNKVRKIEHTFPERSKYRKPRDIAQSYNLLNYTKELANKNALFYYDNALVTTKTGLSIIASKKYASVETLPFTSKKSEVRIYTTK